MVDSEAEEEHGNHPHRRRPCRRDRPAPPGFEFSRNDHQASLPRDHRNPVERASHTDVCRLLVHRKPEDVQTVGGNIMGCRRECDEPEGDKRRGKEGGPLERKSENGDCCAKEELKRHDNAPLRSDQIHRRPPEGLDNPGKVKQARGKSNLSVGDPESFVHDDRNGNHENVRKPFGGIKGRDPEPGIDLPGSTHRSAQNTVSRTNSSPARRERGAGVPPRDEKWQSLKTRRRRRHQSQ